MAGLWKIWYFFGKYCKDEERERERERGNFCCYELDFSILLVKEDCILLNSAFGLESNENVYLSVLEIQNNS